MIKKIGSLLLLISALGAGVKATVSSDMIELGDSVDYTIVASGKDISIGRIEKIGPYKVEGKSKSTQVLFINGTQSNQESHTYRFYPTTNFTIPSYKIIIDGKVVTTEPIAITIAKNPKPTATNSDFAYELKADKLNAYVGEAITLRMIFKAKSGIHLLDYKVYEPNLENFWKKAIKEAKTYTENGYQCEENRFVLYPQKSGVLIIEPARAAVATATGVSPTPLGGLEQPKIKTIFSEPIRLEIKPLPNDIKLYGNFNIQIGADKTEVVAGEPVKISVIVTGDGNFDDIALETPLIDKATVYKEEPKVETILQDGILKSKALFTFVVIPTQNFTIKPYELKYLSSQTKTVQSTTTQPLQITTTQAMTTPDATIIKEQTTTVPSPTTPSNYTHWIYFGVGVLSSLFVMVAYFMVSKLRFKSRDKKSKIKKDKRWYLKELMPFIDKDLEAKTTAKALEDELYGDSKSSVTPKKLSKLLERLHRGN